MADDRAPDAPPGPPGTLGSWEELMEPALLEAAKAGQLGEVPVGAALFSSGGRIIASGHNNPITAQDPTAHAEIAVLRQAAGLVGNYRMPGTILAVTLEPCLMCLGAMVHARIAGLVFGAFDPKAGAIASRVNCADLHFLNHRFWVVGGVAADRSSDLLRRFFLERRGTGRPGA
jgi:tRNA(adenine34) deaminase